MNLSNFPEEPKFGKQGIDAMDKYANKVAKWKVNFEWELREKLEKREGLTELDDSNNVKDVFIGIKEVLGET